MKTKYKGHIYKLPIKYIFVVEFYKAILILKRLKRMVKRICSKHKELYLLPLVSCFLIIITILIGIKFGLYNNFWKGIWDFKETIIISFISTTFVNYYFFQFNWRNKLASQYYLYMNLMYESSMFITTLLYSEKMVVLENSTRIFADRKIMDNIKYIKIKKDDDDIVYCEKLKNKKEVIKYCNDYIKLLKKSRNEFYNKKMVGNFCYYHFDEINQLLNLYKRDKLLVLELVDGIMPIIYEIIASIRRPWRWDLEIDKKIRKIIRENRIYYLNEEIYDPLEHYDYER